MRRRIPIFYSALLLTLVNLLLRFVGTSFQVYLSARIGAAGIGLLQLVMSVGSLGMVAGMAGIRTATMYLTAEELGRGQQKSVAHVLSGCLHYSILFSGSIAVLLYIGAPTLAKNWIGDIRTVDALRLLAIFLPTTCLCGVVTGYFTAANRIGTLAIVEVGEQLCSMVFTISLLHFWAGNDASRACQAVVLGSSLGGCVTLCVLTLLRKRERAPIGAPIPVWGRIARAALPLALADVLRSGISTTENLMVPKRLALHAGTSEPLAAFGVVSGMVFPILMFPACILYALAELLIPELARCNAAGSDTRVRYLTRRSLKVALIYGITFGGLCFLLADVLCGKLYQNETAGAFLRLYAPLIPMLYCDAITDAITKGLGEQRACVRYNILTNALDILFLFLLLPKYGMMGYFASFFVTHLLNFILSLQRLLKITHVRIAPHIPVRALCASVCAVWCASHLSVPAWQVVAYPIVLFCILYLLGIVGHEDLRWLKGLISRAKKVA